MSSARPYWPPLTWALLTLGLYAIPGSDMPNTGLWDVLSLDKIGHVAVFGVFTCTCIVAFRKQGSTRGLQRQAIGWAVGICAVYAAMEWMRLVFSEHWTDGPAGQPGWGGRRSVIISRDLPQILTPEHHLFYF